MWQRRIKRLSIVLGGLMASLAGAQVTSTWPALLNDYGATDDHSDGIGTLVRHGSGQLVAMWSSNYPLAAGVGTDSDVLVSVSSDAGLSWPAPSVLNDSMIDDDVADVFIRAAVDSNGTIIAVWERSDIVCSRSFDAGQTWTEPQVISDLGMGEAGSHRRPHVVSTGAGEWVVAWDAETTSGGVDSDIYFSRSADDGGTWTQAEALNSHASSDSGAGSDDGNVDIASDGFGNVVALWGSEVNIDGSAGTDFDIAVSISSDGGSSWSDAALLHSDMTSDSVPDVRARVAVDQAGNWLAVWESEGGALGPSGVDKDLLCARSVDNGASWTAPQLLNTNAMSDSGDDELATVLVLGTEDFVVGWFSNDPSVVAGIGSDYDVLVARSVDGGEVWSAPSVLNANASVDLGLDYAPLVFAESGAGEWVAAWTSHDTLGGIAGEDADVFISTFSFPPPQLGGPLAVSPSGLIYEGDNVTLQAPPGSNFQWMRQGSPLSDDATIMGADEQTMSLISVSPELNGTYHAVYENQDGDLVATESFLLIVIPVINVPAVTGLGLLVLFAGLAGIGMRWAGLRVRRAK